MATNDKVTLQTQGYKLTLGNILQLGALVADGMSYDVDGAIENFERACEYPTAQYVPFTTLAALYVLQGRDREGLRALDKARRLEPQVSIERMRKIYGLDEERPGSRSQRLIDALLSIGLKED